LNIQFGRPSEGERGSQVAEIWLVKKWGMHECLNAGMLE